jgi:dolichol-phosphate mannosyltransferase
MFNNSGLTKRFLTKVWKPLKQVVDLPPMYCDKTIQSNDKGGSIATIATVAVLFLTIFHLWIAGKTELIPEEAYYWTYSQHPSLSYFDHPPMVAWIITLGTGIFGDNELGVRFFSIFSWPIAALWLFLTGKIWFSNRIASLAVVLFSLSPILAGLGFITTPDTPLLFFWLLTLYGISKALHTGKNRFWLLAGLGLGGALLSKYTAIMLVPSFGLFLLLSDKYRYWLGRGQPWLALLLAALVFTPVVKWNAEHEWASFLFQSSRTTTVHLNPMHEAGIFWGYQVLALSPLLLALFLYALYPALLRGWVMREDAWNFSVSFALPLFLVFVAASFKNKGHVNWTMPAFLTWSLAAAAVLDSKPDWAKRKAKLWSALIALGTLLPIAETATAHTSLAWGIPRLLHLSNAGNWRELAEVVGQARDELRQKTGKPVFIVGGDKLNASAELGFYLHDASGVVNDYALGSQGIGYRYWVDLKTLQNRPAIVVLNKLESDSLERLKKHFAVLENPIEIKVGSPGSNPRSAFIIKCSGYY